MNSTKNTKWIIAGLGNPGEEYAQTRHNVGRMAVNLFEKCRQGAPGDIVDVITPNTYMNLSGGPVAKAMQKCKDNGNECKLIIVHDDIDLPFGTVKVSVGKSAGGQKGVADIIKAIKTKDFVRVRIGITPVFFGKERRPRGAAVARFVLKQFGMAERCTLQKVLEQASDAIAETVRSGAQIAMNKCN